MVEIKGKLATRDMHMFGENSTGSKKLCVWEEAGVIAEDKDSKMSDRGATMMLLATSNAKVTVYKCGTPAPQGLW